MVRKLSALVPPPPIHTAKVKVLLALCAAEECVDASSPYCCEFILVPPLWPLIVCVCVRVSRSVVSTLFDPMDPCSPPSSSVYVILQAILEWVTIPFSRGSS